MPSYFPKVLQDCKNQHDDVFGLKEADAIWAIQINIHNNDMQNTDNKPHYGV